MQKDLTEVKIFQKVLGGGYFLLKHPVLYNSPPRIQGIYIALTANRRYQFTEQHATDRLLMLAIHSVCPATVDLPRFL